MTSSYKCHVCDKAAPLWTLYRVNEKGVPGIWACVEHWTKQDKELKELVEVLEQK